MKKLLIIFSVLFALLLREECHGQGTVKYTAGISYGFGDPIYTPNGNVSKKYVNLTTLRSSTYSGTAWVLDGCGIDVVSGCAAPAYTPGPGQSNIAVNACTESQNGQGPELYVFDGSAWIFINEKSTAPTYTAGTGINISGTVISNTGDLSATNELQNLSLTGQTLGISSGNTVTVPVIAVAPGTGIGVSNSAGTATVTNTGDLSNTNELQTLSSGTNTVTLSNSGGTVTVDTDPANDITSLSGGTGISISGSGNSRTITNTGDLSTTNELQTLSISNDTLSISDGNSVVLPGGGVTWPLLAPNGTALSPSYSFENDTLSGMYLGTKGLTIQGSVINVKAFAADDGGSFLMSSGEGLANAGGEFRLSAGNSSVSDGGQFNLNAGNSDVANGGQFSMAAGNGATGGDFTMSAGDGEIGGGFSARAGVASAGDGGYFILNAGRSDAENQSGGYFEIVAGSAPNGYGGYLALYGGGSRYDIEAGSLQLSGGNQGEGNEGVVNFLTAVEYYSYTSSQIAAKAYKRPGMQVYCSNCTANDGSTGVIQTYNGSAWKNHW